MEAFARDVLGCRCPPEVFRQVGVEEAVTAAGVRLARRIRVGDRLLIYVAEAGDLPADRDDALAALCRAGAAERDALGFNRFRLALVDGGPAAPAAPPLPDDHCHFHRLSREEVPWVDACC